MKATQWNFPKKWLQSYQFVCSKGELDVYKRLADGVFFTWKGGVSGGYFNEITDDAEIVTLAKQASR